MMTMIMMITMIPHLLLVWSDVIRFGAGGREGGAAIGPDSRRTCTSENISGDFADMILLYDMI